MASYLKPRRGRKSTAITQAMVLKRGEVFFEIDENGITTGADAKACGKIKMGDGTTTYANLGYFIDVETSPIAFPDTPAASETYQGEDFYQDLNDLTPNSTVSTIISKTKALLYNLSAAITELKSTSRIPEWEFLDGYSTDKGIYQQFGQTFDPNSTAEMLSYILHFRSQAFSNGKVFPFTNISEEPVAYQGGVLNWPHISIPEEGDYSHLIHISNIRVFTPGDSSGEYPNDFRLAKSGDKYTIEINSKSQNYYAISEYR